MTYREMRMLKEIYELTIDQLAEESGLAPGEVVKILDGKPSAGNYQKWRALENVFRKRIERVAESGAAYAAENFQEKRPGAYTWEDYLALPDEMRVELIDGVVYDLGAPLGSHQLLAGAMYALIRDFIRGRKGECMPFIAPVDVRLDCDDRTVVQPDVLILCDKSKFRKKYIMGAPDFCLEVLSPSTRSKDMFIKLNKYRDAGVREYWMVDPVKKMILTYLFDHGDEFAVYGFRDSIPVGIFGGDLRIDFAEIDDEVKDWL